MFGCASHCPAFLFFFLIFFGYSGRKAGNLVRLYRYPPGEKVLSGAKSAVVECSLNISTVLEFCIYSEAGSVNVIRGVS